MPGQQIPGKLEVQTSDGSTTTITLDGDNGTISTGGDVTVYNIARKEKVRIGAESASAILAQDASGRIFLDISDFGPGLGRTDGGGGSCGLYLGAESGNKAGLIKLRGLLGHDTILLNGEAGDITMVDPDGNRSFTLRSWGIDHQTAGMTIGASAGPKAGYVAIKNSPGNDSIVLNGVNHSIALRDNADIESIALNGSNNSIILRDNAGKDSIVLNGSNNSIALRDTAGRNSIIMDGNSGDIVLRDQKGKLAFNLASQTGGGAGMWIGGDASPSQGPKSGYVAIRNSAGNDSIILNGDNNSVAIRDMAGNNNIIMDGVAGDIFLNNADCAEEFDVSAPEEMKPGTVMVIEEEGKLRQSMEAYDKKVAGVISGAGDCKPGIVLDKKHSQVNRKAVALMGKVYCKVDAQSSPIEVGDLLTTSSIPGHAMKAADPLKAFGAVIGKALRPLETGKGLIPILIALQ